MYKIEGFCTTRTSLWQDFVCWKVRGEETRMNFLIVVKICGWIESNGFNSTEKDLGQIKG